MAVSEDVWKVWLVSAPGTAVPFSSRARLIVSGKLTPEAGAIFPWKATAYRPRVVMEKSLLPAVWVMLVPTVVEFWSNNRAVLLVPGAEGVE